MIVLLGYGWQTNQRGLTIDHVVAYELVKPDGAVVSVTEDSDSELFWGLKVSGSRLAFSFIRINAHLAGRL